MQTKYTLSDPARFCSVCQSHLRNHQKQFCSQKCHGLTMRGSNHPGYKGGTVSRDYILQSVNGVQICEHRLLMEAHLGRSLLKTEVVHHKDGNKQNNSIDNLQLCSSQAEHAALHRRTFVSETHKQC